MNTSKDFREGFLAGLQAAKEQEQTVDSTLLEMAQFYYEQFKRPMVVDNKVIYPTKELCTKANPEAVSYMSGFLEMMKKGVPPL